MCHTRFSSKKIQRGEGRKEGGKDGNHKETDSARTGPTGIHARGLGTELRNVVDAGYRRRAVNGLVISEL